MKDTKVQKECICELLDKPTYEASRDPHSLEKNWDCPIHGHQERYWLIHTEKQPYCVPCSATPVHTTWEEKLRTFLWQFIGHDSATHSRLDGTIGECGGCKADLDGVVRYVADLLAHAKEEGRAEANWIEAFQSGWDKGHTNGRAAAQKEVVEKYGDFRELQTGRTLRFYLLPHTEHKPGDDGSDLPPKEQ